MGMMNQEIWKAVKGYEGLYEVSNYGNVRSVPRNNTKGKILKPYISKQNGYCTVSLSKNNKKKTVRVHCILMQAFNPANKKPGYDAQYTIDHKDGNKTNNRLDNLEWCSQSENQKRAYALEINGKSTKKVINLDTKEIFNSVTDAAASVGGKRANAIARVCKGKRSHYRNVHFAYYEDYVNNTIPQFKSYTKRSSENLWR